MPVIKNARVERGGLYEPFRKKPMDKEEV